MKHIIRYYTFQYISFPTGFQKYPCVMRSLKHHTVAFPLIQMYSIEVLLKQICFIMEESF